jgi:hypothetical protein
MSWVRGHDVGAIVGVVGVLVDDPGFFGAGGARPRGTTLAL